MLLNELIGVKKYYGSNEYKMERLLRRFGIRFIAAGKYGKIFTHPGWNYVVKIFSNDPYYLGFVNYAIAHPNPHYPKVIRKPLQMHNFMRRSVRGPDKFWIVKIEKLRALPPEKVNLVVEHLEQCVQYWYDTYVRKLPKAKVESNSWFWSFKDNSNGEKVFMHEFVKTYPWMLSLAKAWNDIFDNISEGSPDLHEGNFMERSDGTVVIIDPLWAGTNPEAEYQRYLEREYSQGLDDDEPENIRGPNYIVKKQQAASQAASQAARNVAVQMGSEYSDDIPF